MRHHSSHPTGNAGIFLMQSERSECIRDVGTMSVGVEREARSIALEKAYVHQVYQQISSQYQENHKSRSWPRIKQFLEDLEPGSLVCDVGCGNGKYLTVNPSVYKLGADRCSKLAEAAREKENEVLLCDNLALPFRDETFDAVLSIAVVHHFATTERRVGALRELARILRIGGRLVISVWAMEQRHRKFESQDVLVPWHRPQHLSTPSLELTSTTTTTSEEDGPPPYHAYTQTSDSDSCRSARAAGSGQRKRGRSRHKGRSIDPAKPMTSSPSSSSLSSPNETCYSFVRRALQKLAGGKRGGSRHRPWFLDSWTSCAKEPPTHRYDPEGCEDIHNLPIELRRLEEEQDAPQRRQTIPTSHQLSDVPLNHKSKSLSDILTVEQKAIVRSRSSVPSLEVAAPPEDATTSTGTTPETSTPGSKPRLIKQKKSVCEEDFEGEEGDEPTDMRDLIRALPEFKISGYGSIKRGNVFKQSSMNEELMSTERLREKERVRQNIQKQASLNEELMFRRNRTLDSLRDTLFSASTAKRFQLLKNGFTNKIKSSTTGIEKVAGASFKNGFVRILQGWTGGDVVTPIPQPAPPPQPTASPNDTTKLAVEERRECERRHSREDGSDSSKDSSLQSDTSVDSEDSFASVIFVPKPEPPPDQTSTNTSPTLQSNPASPQPTSPKFKLPPPISPKLKQSPQLSFGMSSHPSSPKLKHSLTLMGSPTPGSPKIKYFSQPTSPRPYQTTFLTSPTSKASFKLQSSSPNGSHNTSPTCKAFPFAAAKPMLSLSSYALPNIGHITPTSPTADEPRQTETSPLLSPVKPTSPKPPSPKDPRTVRAKSLTSPKEDLKVSTLRPNLSPGVSPTSPNNDLTKQICGTTAEDVKVTSSTTSVTATTSASTTATTTSTSKADKHVERLKQIQELLRSKTSKGNPRNAFPLVRRSMTSASGSESVPATRALPRLMSLELFNPETDDMDSDSSGVSSPDSVGSVISVLNDDEHPAAPQDSVNAESQSKTETSGGVEEATAIQYTVGSGSSQSLPTALSSQEKIKLEIEEAPAAEPSTTRITTSRSPKVSPSHSLLEAAADVASTLEETVDAVIQSSPRAKRKQIKLYDGSDPLTVLLQDDLKRRSYEKLESTSPSVTDESEGRSNRWSLQADYTVKFSQLETTRASSLGAIPKKIKQRHTAKLPKPEPVIVTDNKVSTVFDDDAIANKEESWDEECRQHLAEFAEKLSEKLLAEIDRYREQTSYMGRPTSAASSSVITDLPSNIKDMNDPYLNRLSEELQDLTKLSLELHERHNSFINRLKDTDAPRQYTSVLRSPDAADDTLYTVDQRRICLSQNIFTMAEQASTSSERNTEVPSSCGDCSSSSSTILCSNEQSSEIVCSGNKSVLTSSSSSTSCTVVVASDDGVTKPTCEDNNQFTTYSEVVISSSDRVSDDEKRCCSDFSVVDQEPQQDNVDEPVDGSRTLVNKEDELEPVTITSTTDKNDIDHKSDIKIELSDAESPSESDTSWADSRRNTILPVYKSLDLVGGSTVVKGEDDVTRIQILPGSEMPRRPSISVESSDPLDKVCIREDGPLRSGVSLESCDAGDISERTGSSSEGSRAGSRRDTIQISDSGSVLSLRPGLSLESSDAGDISERTGTGSDGSRSGDSRRNTISIDQTSGSQASLLRPGMSLESSECGDGSDSRRDTSSAGKTASTASLVSDCSRDARYADRRITRCDGRSSSEETAPRSCTNKLVRQQASTQEPPETLTKTESCETSLSGSTSQESLLSDTGGGAITFHRYYHVFREGELDQLIERYVENLHIISSYYDHANWCVVAEKVHVWTI